MVPDRTVVASAYIAGLLGAGLAFGHVLGCLDRGLDAVFAADCNERWAAALGTASMPMHCVADPSARMFDGKPKPAKLTGWNTAGFHLPHSVFHFDPRTDVQVRRRLNARQGLIKN